MKIVIEIPHQMPAEVTLYSDESAILEGVQNSNEYFMYQPTNLAEVKKEIGMDEEDFAEWVKKYHPELNDFADETPLIELAYNCHNGNYVLASKAPSEYDWALESLGDDLNSLYVFDTWKEAVQHFATGTHHQGTRISARLESPRFRRDCARERLFEYRAKRIAEGKF